MKRILISLMVALFLVAHPVFAADNTAAINEQLKKISTSVTAIEKLLQAEPIPIPSPQKPVVSGDLYLVTVYNIGYVRCFGAALNDKYIVKSFWEATQAIGVALKRDFPDRKADKIELTRAGPIDDSKPSTHLANGRMLDIHYFTKGATNHTQSGSFGEPLVEIWDENGELTSLFDAERTLAAMKMFRKVFPKFQAVTVSKIKAAMGAVGREYDWIGSMDQENMYHDSHWHADIGGAYADITINKEAQL